jgi:hypothetical protein
MNSDRNIYRITLIAILSTFLSAPSIEASPSSPLSATQKRLEHGDVIVDMQDVGSTKYVTGKILIDESIDHVWSVLTNPFEYAHQVCKRIKQVEVLQDSVERSEVKCGVDGGLFLPPLSYVIESKYAAPNRVEFRRLSGNIKDFKGSWVMNPTADRKKTEVTYSTFIEPGFPLPQWIIREGLKIELPKTMSALRDRVDAIFKEHAKPDPKSIVASRVVLDERNIADRPVSISEIGSRN